MMKNPGMMSVRFLVALLGMAVMGCGGPGEDSSMGEGGLETTEAGGIDQRSYRLGSIGAFAEMVGAGVKRLALSAPMEAQEMEALMEEARRIAAEHGVDTYLEEDFLVTDLFPAELTQGKQVLFILQDETLEEYLALKAEKARLQNAGEYEGENRSEIARAFGRLLSYSHEKIESLLREGEEGP